MAQIQHHAVAQVPGVPATQTSVDVTAPEPPKGSLLEQVLAAAFKQRYDRAISLCSKQGGQDLDVVNARGVCLIRVGRYEEAVTLFRNLALQPGCTWMRTDRPTHYKTNFATALLLSGRPSGCLEMLHAIGDPAPPAAGMLRDAIKRWETTLPFWAWLNWRAFRIEPDNRPVVVDFQPGDFGFAATADA